MTHVAAALPTAPAQGSLAARQIRADLLCAAAVALLAGLVFANAVANGFVLDDRGVLLGNPLVQNLAESWRAVTLPYWPESLGGGQYRPLGILSFALDWRLGGGDPAWFHAMNVAWHALATALVWRLATQLLRPLPALLCAALFAVHPVHVEAVANVVGRLELMSAAFALGMVLAHRASSWFALPLFALALCSKENAIVAVALVLASDLLLAREAARPNRKLYVGYAAVLLLYVVTLLLVFNDQSFAVKTGTLAGASLSARLWTMATVVPHYARLLLFPAALSADYEPQVIPSVNGLTLPGAVGLLLLASYILALVVAWRRQRRFAFALLWIAAALAPVANVFFVSGVTLAERTLYLPSVGAMLALGFLLEAVSERRVAAAIAAGAVLLVAGAWRTWTRTSVWRDDGTYLRTLLAEHPESYRAHWVAGRVHRALGDVDAARHELALARRLFPRASGVYLDAAELADLSRNPREAALLRDSAAALNPGARR